MGAMSPILPAGGIRMDPPSGWFIYVKLVARKPLKAHVYLRAKLVQRMASEGGWGSAETAEIPLTAYRTMMATAAPTRDARRRGGNF